MPRKTSNLIGYFPKYFFFRQSFTIFQHLLFCVDLAKFNTVRITVKKLLQISHFFLILFAFFAIFIILSAPFLFFPIFHNILHRFHQNSAIKTHQLFGHVQTPKQPQKLAHLMTQPNNSLKLNIPILLNKIIQTKILHILFSAFNLILWYSIINLFVS